MPYRLEITIQGLPKTTNSGGRLHWSKKIKEAKLWKRRVQAMVLISSVREPLNPLKFARVICIRYSSGECDYDGLVSSFKHPIDGLVAAGVLENDKMTNFVGGHPDYFQEKCLRGKGKIKIIVEEIE